MLYKITEGFRKNKKLLIIGLVLWVIVAIVLVLPFTVAKNVAILLTQNDPNLDFLTKFFEVFGQAIKAPGQSIGYIFKHAIFGDFFSNIFVLTIFYLIIFIIGFVRTMPKNQYDNIEHGSSDWSTGGEQYKVLSNKAGIILAENN